MYDKQINIKNRVYTYCFDYLIYAKELKTKNILFDGNNKDLVIYFPRYDRGKSIRMLSLSYHEFIGKTEEYEGKILDDLRYLGESIRQD